jgi:hypothetical protein
VSAAFELRKRDPSSKARVGCLTTPHGSFETPAFMPVGSKGAVKTLSPADLREVGADILGLQEAQRFQIRSLALLEVLRADQQAKNLLRGVHLPLTLPKCTVADYGTTLEETFLPGVKLAYQAEFSGRKFVNHREGTLAGQVSVVPEPRQDKLLAKLAEGPVTGIYFPVALQGFSIPAAREIIQMLPEGFILTGALETAVALTGYPGTLSRDYQTPGLDCAANVWQSPGYSLLFEAFDGQLEFGHGYLFAFGYYSSGLLVLG